MNAFHAYQKIERRIVELELLTRGSTVVDKEVGRVVKDRKDEYYVIETYRTYASELNACQDQSTLIEKLAQEIMASRQQKQKKEPEQTAAADPSTEVESEKDEVTVEESEEELEKESVSEKHQNVDPKDANHVLEKSATVAADSMDARKPAPSLAQVEVALKEEATDKKAETQELQTVETQSIATLTQDASNRAPRAEVKLVLKDASKPLAKNVLDEKRDHTGIAQDKVAPSAANENPATAAVKPSANAHASVTAANTSACTTSATTATPPIFSLEEVDQALDAQFHAAQPRRYVKVAKDWRQRARALVSQSTENPALPPPETPAVPHAMATAATTRPTTNTSRKRTLEDAEALERAEKINAEQRLRIALLEAELARTKAQQSELTELVAALGKRAKIAEDRQLSLQSVLEAAPLAARAQVTNTGADALAPTRALRFLLLDTNLFMHRLVHVKMLFAAPQVVLIVPLVVLRELDQLKTHRDTATAQMAREAMRWLQEAAHDVNKLRGQAPHELWQSPTQSHAPLSADDWIVNCARWYVDHFGRDRVALVSEDRNLVLKARLHYDVPALPLEEALQCECPVQLGLNKASAAGLPARMLSGTGTREHKEAWREQWRRASPHRRLHAANDPKQRGFYFEAPVY